MRNKRRRVLLAVLLLAVLGGLGWLALRSPGPPDPIYEGKRLSQWLEGYDTVTNPVLINPRPVPSTNIGMRAVMVGAPFPVQPTSTPESVAADEALEHFGTNAFPTIAWMLRKRDSAWRMKLLELLSKQYIIKIYHTPSSHWNRAGTTALEKLGKPAEAAVPMMGEIYEEGIDAMTRTSGHDYWAENMVLALPPIWGQLGPAARGAIPSLLRGAAFTNANVRWVAITALGKIRCDAATVIPVLTNALRDLDIFVRQNAVTALGEFGREAEPVIPAIVEMSDDPDHWVRSATWRTLGRLHANPAVVVPALINALNKSTNNYEAFDIVVTLRTLGPDAKPAVPAMIESLKRQPNENIRGNIRVIIREIDPAAAEKAGIKN